MAHRHFSAIDIIGNGPATVIWCKMRHNLMTKQVKVDPVARVFAAFRAAQQPAIKAAGRLQIMNRKCQMKAGSFGVCHENPQFRDLWKQAGQTTWG